MRTSLRLLALAVLALTLTGCAMVHGWAGGGSGESPHAGASINLPLGK